MQLEEMTMQTFEPLVDSKFIISFRDHEPVQLLLTSVKTVMEQVRSSRLHRQPFILVFEGPAEFCLSQGMYAFSHEAIGEHVPFFIVPTGRGEGGYQYEAVFT